MFAVVPEWSVSVTFEGDITSNMEFRIADRHFQNVLRAVAVMSFNKEVVDIRIRPYTPPINQARAGSLPSGVSVTSQFAG